MASAANAEPRARGAIVKRRQDFIGIESYRYLPGAGQPGMDLIS